MFTKIYINMSKKAKEIQKLKPIGIWNLHYDPEHENDPTKLDDNDYLYVSFYYLPKENHIAILKWDNDEGHPIIGSYSDNKEEAIWLPTQKKLQEMSDLSWWKFDERCNEIRRCLLEDPLSEIEVETKEEAGICVVMEKYHKIWNGKEWTKKKRK